MTLNEKTKTNKKTKFFNKVPKRKSVKQYYMIISHKVILDFNIKPESLTYLRLWIKYRILNLYCVIRHKRS